MVLDRRTKGRARALQLLYAWDIHGATPVAALATGLCRVAEGIPAGLEDGERLAAGVIAEVADLDRAAAAAAEHWRLERLGVIERNILRLGIHELRRAEAPPKAVINEAVRLAHWFAGPRSPGFINGVLDHVARGLGRL